MSESVEHNHVGVQKKTRCGVVWPNPSASEAEERWFESSLLDMITFKRVRDAYGWMSNMSPHPVTTQLWDMDPVVWSTAEHLFQASRFQKWVLLPNDGTQPTPEQLAQVEEGRKRSDVIKEIRATKSPMAAKMIAKKHADKMVIEPRSMVDIHLMKNVLRLKLKSNPHLIKELLDTGDELLVEDVTARPNESGLFWGKALVEGQWVGLNVLGNAWMDLRAACKAGKEHAEEWL